MTLYLHYWTLISFSLLITTSPYWSTLPSVTLLPLALIIAVIAIWYRKARGLLGLALACIVILMHGNLLRYQTETLFQAGEDINIIADVDSLFKPINYGFQGFVVVRSINGQPLTTLTQPKIRLNSPLPLQLGDSVQADVSLKRIYGLMNEVGYDAEKQALIDGIVGVASIDRKQSYYWISHSSWRARLIEQIEQRTMKLEQQGMVLALLFGIREHISAEKWQQLQHSGLSHLIAISGLHIGIAFGVGWCIGLLLLVASPRWSPMPLTLGLMCALGYAWLAGFSLPTQRAFLMCLIACAIQVRAGYLPSLYKWLLVLSLLLAFAPFTVVSASLWMSMVAVGIIFFYQAKVTKRGYLLVDAIKIQLFLVCLMAPIVSYLFHGLSLAAIGYNLVFVPWFSFIVIPLLFLTIIAHWLLPWWDLPWMVVDLSLMVVDWALPYAQFSWLAVSSAELFWLCVVIALALISRITSRRFVGLCWLCVILNAVNWRNTPLWQVRVLDVGHGLAVIVEQGNRALVYDTGASWSTSSIAEQIVTPSLIVSGIEQLDYLVISHFDNDHAGGADELIQQWQPKQVLTSQNRPRSQACISGQAWQWQGVRISALWPPRTTQRAYNPHSCVIKLEHIDSDTSILFAGDIEAIAEWILSRQPEPLESDILIVPHHGSKTSSGERFIAAVSPQVAIASLAKGGRWQLPSSEVVSRYQNLGAMWMDTGEFGQIIIDLYSQGYQISGLRVSKGQSWYRQMLRNGVE